MHWLLYDQCKNGYRHKRNIYGKTEKSGDDGYKRERVDTAVKVDSLWEDRERRQGGMFKKSSYGRTKKNGKGVVM